jgi:transcriptional regulator with XRE-family HTH domain
MMEIKTDAEVMQLIGERLRAYRLQRNLSQEKIARLAGLNQKTVSSAEAGHDPRLLTLVKILRALGRLDALDAFLPEPQVSPLALVIARGRVRKRARSPRRA